MDSISLGLASSNRNGVLPLVIAQTSALFQIMTLQQLSTKRTLLSRASVRRHSSIEFGHCLSTPSLRKNWKHMIVEETTIKGL